MQKIENQNIRKYEHETLQGALVQLKSDLGDHARIIRTRQVNKKGKFGIGTQVMFEIQACPAINKDEGSSSNSSWLGQKYGMTSADMPRKMRGNADVDSRPMPVRSDSIEKMSADIDSLKGMIQEIVLRGRDKEALSGLSEELQNLYQDLIKEGVSVELARQLTEGLNVELTGADLNDRKRLREELQNKVANKIKISAPLHVRGDKDRSKVVAFIGPTGVGKTTTISKLAGYCHHYENQHVALITLDTYRIAASDQLQRVAQIVDVPISVETSPQGLKDTIHKYRDKDIVFIDTAGRSQRDALHMNDLKNFLKEAEPDEVHLVMPSQVDSFTMRSILENFGPMATHLCLSKLDEALRLGTLLEAILNSDLPLTYWTFGQSIPDDIATVDPARLARLLLGLETL